MVSWYLLILNFSFCLPIHIAIARCILPILLAMSMSSSCNKGLIFRKNFSRFSLSENKLLNFPKSLNSLLLLKFSSMFLFFLIVKYYIFAVKFLKKKIFQKEFNSVLFGL